MRGRARSGALRFEPIDWLLFGEGLTQDDVPRGDDRIDVNSDRVRHATRVSARQCGCDRDSPAARVLEYQSVALLQSFKRQRKAAQLVFAVGVRSSYIKNQVRRHLL